MGNDDINIFNSVLWDMMGYLSEEQWQDAYARYKDLSLEKDFKILISMFDVAYRTDIHGLIYGEKE